ncbi:hypothetical protein PQX77_012568, partial [Marasmius sp. AFHP31]
MSTYFPDCQKLRINDGNFSHVGRDQHNHYSQINQIVQQKEKERTAFDDFRNVRQGDFCRLRDIGINWYRRDCPCMLRRRRCWDCKREKWKVDRTICLAEVDGSPGQVYTAVSYSGPDARKAFEADFQTYSQVLSSQVAQIYAIDIGTVPSLLFRNELVPLAHFEKHLSWSVWLHLGILLGQWECGGAEVWIDSARGVMCRGPAGPDSHIVGWSHRAIWDAPFTVDFLQEDVVLCFFVSKKLREVDRTTISWIAAGNAYPGYVPELVNPHTVEVISTLSNTPIAIAARHQTWNYSYSLLEENLLENGSFRFRLDNGRWFKLEWGLDARDAWLSQAWSVFHTLGITVEDNLEAFDFVRHLGYDKIVFQPIVNLARIEEIHEEPNSRQPSDPHVDFVVYDSDGHTSDSDGDSTADSGDHSDSGSDCSTDLDNEPSSESDSEGLLNTPQQDQLADLASSSSFQAQDVVEGEFATALDGGASKRQRT